jgi:hypothetical protein
MFLVFIVFFSFLSYLSPNGYLPVGRLGPPVGMFPPPYPGHFQGGPPPMHAPPLPGSAMPGSAMHGPPGGPPGAPPGAAPQK